MDFDVYLDEKDIYHLDNGKMINQEDLLSKQALLSMQANYFRSTNYPNADNIYRQGLLEAPRSKDAVDVLLVNPPTPENNPRPQFLHRVSRHTCEHEIWPHISLAQIAAVLHPTYTVAIIDAKAEQMGLKEFEALVERYEPRYYLTYLTAPFMKSDMYGVFLAKSLKANTIAFGPFITPVPVETMRTYPCLDYAIIGEPELTLRDLLDHLEMKIEQRSPMIQTLFQRHDPNYRLSLWEGSIVDFSRIKGLAWRQGDHVVVNSPRPLIADLDDLPLPKHDLLPVRKSRIPINKGPFSIVVTSRGCARGCTFCVTHSLNQSIVRLRKPEKIIDELVYLKSLGINNVHMCSDLFTLNRHQVMELCDQLIQARLSIKWTCNSHPDSVDEIMLSMMGRSGCQVIYWGIESAGRQVLGNVQQKILPENVVNALRWSKKAGIQNWGCFIFGLPGETEETIRKTIHYSKNLPFDMAIFQIATPYPGTPLFFQVIKEGWFRPGIRFGRFDENKVSAITYPHLPAERIEYWHRRAFREWIFRPGHFVFYLQTLLFESSIYKSATAGGLRDFAQMDSLE